MIAAKLPSPFIKGGGSKPCIGGSRVKEREACTFESASFNPFRSPAFRTTRRTPFPPFCTLESQVISNYPILTESNVSAPLSKCEEAGVSEQNDQSRRSVSSLPAVRGGRVLSRKIECLLSETRVGARWSDPDYAYAPAVRGRTAEAANLRKPAVYEESEVHGGLTPLRDGRERRLDTSDAVQLDQHESVQTEGGFGWAKRGVRGGTSEIKPLRGFRSERTSLQNEFEDSIPSVSPPAGPVSGVWYVDGFVADSSSGGRQTHPRAGAERVSSSPQKAPQPTISGADIDELSRGGATEGQFNPLPTSYGNAGVRPGVFSKGAGSLAASKNLAARELGAGFSWGEAREAVEKVQRGAKSAGPQGAVLRSADTGKEVWRRNSGLSGEGAPQEKERGERRQWGSEVGLETGLETGSSANDLDVELERFVVRLGDLANGASEKDMGYDNQPGDPFLDTGLGGNEGAGETNLPRFLPEPASSKPGMSFGYSNQEDGFGVDHSPWEPGRDCLLCPPSVTPSGAEPKSALSRSPQNAEAPSSKTTEFVDPLAFFQNPEPLTSKETKHEVQPSFFTPPESDTAQSLPKSPGNVTPPLLSDAVQLGVGEFQELPPTAFYDEHFLERFQYTRPPPNRNLPLFLDFRDYNTAPEQPMPPPFYPRNCRHEKSGPLPGYPHGRVPRPKLPGPLLNGRRPEFWVVNPNDNKLVVPRAARSDPRGKFPGVKTLLEGWTGRGLRTREEVLGEPLSEEEITELIEGAVHDRREVYLGRDGLTWNMVGLIHTHWRRRPVCKVKCKGIFTVDMPKVLRELERSAGGHVIWQQGGTVLLFRGRNYHWKDPPVLELPEDRSADKKRTQETNPVEDRNPDGMGKLESLELSKRMNREDPIVWLDKNGYYGGLVHTVRTFFSKPENDLAVIKCPMFVPGDVVKLAIRLKALVPATVFQVDKDRKQRIVLYRTAGWECPTDELTRLAETDKRPAYYPKRPPQKRQPLRKAVEEQLIGEEEEEGVWGSWGNLFEPPRDDPGWTLEAEL